MISDSQQVKAYIKDTLIHKRFLITSGMKMIDYLYDEGRYEDALELSHRCEVHDNSKMESDELALMSQLPAERKKTMGERKSLTEEQRALIKLHWSRNRHHPEYFKDYHEMTDMDVMEMCCDWYARSLQFGTDLIDYAEYSNADRFHFDDEFFSNVMKYCKILAG